MRKNLFLTFALLFASFAGINAQNWSVTLGSTEGLPGEEVVLDDANIVFYKSGIIRAEKPIKTLRFTCAGNRANAKPNGNNFIFALSELNVYDADNLTEELSYTVKSNADHNTLTKSFDGLGLKALYDGKYNNYFHSIYAEKGAVAEYHYLELTFEEPIERFIIEWGVRPNSAKDSPTTVVLTEGGVSAEPYTDRSASFGDEKIATLDELAEAAYFTICGNAVAEYYSYNNQTGEKDKEPQEGSGPMYVTLGNTYAEQPTIDYVTKLVPADDDTYYVYFPMQKMYLSGDATQNQLNAAQNGWQLATADINKAAKVTVTSIANGDFELSYETSIKVEGENPYEYNGIVYIAADPRTGRMKIFSPDKKEALEKNKWCEGFGIECAFNWSFYPADYQAPKWANEYEIGLLYLTATKFNDAIKDVEAAADFTEDVAGCIAELDEAMADIDNMNIDDISVLVSEAKATLGDAIYNIADVEAYFVMAEQWETWNDNSGEGLQYTKAAYDTYIKPGKDLMTSIEKAEEDEYFDYIEAMIEYFANKEYNINKFLASEFAKGLPMEFTNLQNKEVEQQIVVQVEEPLKGFRWTLMATHSNNKNGAGYPFTSFAELEVVNNTTGEPVVLDATRITSNSNQSGEGTIAGLLDGFKTVEGYTGEQYGWYWHAIWGNGAHNPDGEVFLDVLFPEGTELNNFTIKFTHRGDQLHNAPKDVVISEYGKEHDYVEGEANPYKVAIGNKVTELSQLVDGKLYILQGNLNVNLDKNAATPRYYAGTKPFGTNAKDVEEDCVYMLQKAGDAWNILSLSNAQYWANNESMLDVLQSKAANIQIVKSQNMTDTWVLYSPIDTVLSSNYEHEISETETIKFDSVGVNVKALVYMDWDGSLASRECYDPQPGVADPRFTQLTDELKVSSSCGDYLHYNKTNGEGEWTIYEATMNDEYYVYLQALVEEAKNLNLVTGKNPGCILADEATAKAYDDAMAAAEVAVNSENKAVAEATAKALVEALGAIAESDRVGFDANSVYRIESALEAFLKNTWYTRSIYANGATIEWTVTPENFENENHNFLFKVIKVDEEVAAEYRLNIPENDADKAYIFQNIFNAKYVGDEWGFAERPAHKLIENIGVCVYNIKQAGGGMWHANNHSNGNGYGSNLVTFAGGVNTASAWTFIYVGSAEDYPLSVEDVVVKGDEVVSVNYYTPAGVAVAEPVKGINIVVTVYANGVVEAKKVLVK